MPLSKNFEIDVPLLELCDTGAALVYDTTELVSENVALLHLHDSAVKQVQVRTADCGTSDLDDNVTIL